MEDGNDLSPVFANNDESDEARLFRDAAFVTVKCQRSCNYGEQRSRPSYSVSEGYITCSTASTCSDRSFRCQASKHGCGCHQEPSGIHYFYLYDIQVPSFCHHYPTNYRTPVNTIIIDYCLYHYLHVCAMVGSYGSSCNPSRALRSRCHAEALRNCYNERHHKMLIKVVAQSSWSGQIMIKFSEAANAFTRGIEGATLRRASTSAIVHSVGFV